MEIFQYIQAFIFEVITLVMRLVRRAWNLCFNPKNDYFCYLVLFADSQKVHYLRSPDQKCSILLY